MPPPDERISIEVGDITASGAEAIVNAANSQLLPGGGVCGAIHAAGGPRIADECATLIATQFPSGVPVGQAVATTAGDLPARCVIHAVGPRYGADPDPDERLADAYRNSLRVAREEGVASAAFPALSTGIYGFPPERAAAIVWRTLSELVRQQGAPRVRLVFFTARDRDVFVANRDG